MKILAKNLDSRFKVLPAKISKSIGSAVESFGCCDIHNMMDLYLSSLGKRCHRHPGRVMGYRRWRLLEKWQQLVEIAGASQKKRRGILSGQLAFQNPEHPELAERLRLRLRPQAQKSS